MDRKLAAIMAVDVVGYSALMEADETGTHERLKAARKELFEPEIARHNGRVFKIIGDGLLAEFDSVGKAIECAVVLQRGLVTRNAALPSDQRFGVRIGINLGEVIVEGDDRYGDGVNIAARIEQLADAGGIFVSGKVVREVEKRMSFGFEPMGRHKVKNIKDPIEVYRVTFDGVAQRGNVQGRTPSQHPWKWVALVAGVVVIAGSIWLLFREPGGSPGAAVGMSGMESKLSLVVLPFDNLSDDKDQEYLADGLTEDLTTALAQLPGLFVVSRNAAATYKNKPVQPPDLGKALGVRYVLEGSTRRLGDEVRINAQLIDAATGGHLWAERFEGKWSEVFALQDTVTRTIADALQLRYLAGSSNAKSVGGTENPAAYEAFLRGYELEVRNSPDDISRAIALYEQALALDPGYGRAAAELANVYWGLDEADTATLNITWEEVNERFAKVLASAAQHPSPTYYQISAELLIRQHRSDDAIVTLQKAIPLDPSDPWTFFGLSQAMIFNGRPEEGRSYLAAAIRLDPTAAGGWPNYRKYLAGLAAFGEERFADAINLLETIDLQSPDSGPKFFGLQVLLSAYGHLGRQTEIAATRTKLETVFKERHEPGHYNRLVAQTYLGFKNKADLVRLLDGLRKADVPEFPSEVEARTADRLTVEEMHSLIFGHELQGRQIEPDAAEYHRITAADGTTTLTLGSNTRHGTSWMQEGALCVAYVNAFTCGVVLRDPSGTRGQSNEYDLIFQDSRYEFSIVK